MFPKDIWCLLFRDYFDCKTYINCYRSAKSLRRFMTLNQIQTCERFTEFKKNQKQLILKRTVQLRFGLCSICGKRQNWNSLSKHQRSCKKLPEHLRADQCEECSTPLPYVSGLAHKPCYQTMCPFDEIRCMYCAKTILRIENVSHDRCTTSCRRCGACVPANVPPYNILTGKYDHECLNQCNAIIEKRAFSGSQTIIRKCSRKQEPNSKFCFQHRQNTDKTTCIQSKRD